MRQVEAALAPAHSFPCGHGCGVHSRQHLGHAVSCGGAYKRPIYAFIQYIHIYIHGAYKRPIYAFIQYINTYMGLTNDLYMYKLTYICAYIHTYMGLQMTYTLHSYSTYLHTYIHGASLIKVYIHGAYKRPIHAYTYRC